MIGNNPVNHAQKSCSGSLNNLFEREFKLLIFSHRCQLSLLSSSIILRNFHKLKCSSIVMSVRLSVTNVTLPEPFVDIFFKNSFIQFRKRKLGHCADHPNSLKFCELWYEMRRCIWMNMKSGLVTSAGKNETHFWLRNLSPDQIKKHNKTGHRPFYR